MYYELQDDPSTYHLTGLGYVKGNRLVASKISTISYLDPGAKVTMRVKYTFHEICRVMLFNRVGCADGSGEAGAVPYWLFHMFESLPYVVLNVDRRLLPEHGYHGTLPFQTDIMRAEMGAPDAAEDPPTLEQAVSPPVHPTGTGPARGSSSDAFSKIPPEIVAQILTILPSPDVCHLRASSRSVAALSRGSQLPQSFWASRFAPDMEMGFVLAHQQDMDVRGTRDWRRLYYSSRGALLSETRHKGIQVRRRIWLSIEEFAATLRRLLVGRDVVHGDSNLLPLFPSIKACQWVAFLENREDTMRRRVSYATRRRKLGTLGLTRPDPSSTLVLKVYSIRFDCQTYISGFQVYCQPEEHNQELRLLQEIGLITSAEESLRLEPGDSIAAIGVVMRVAGIHGLRFFIKREGSMVEETVGNVRVPDASVGVARLEAEDRIFGIRIGFDVRAPFVFADLGY